MYYFVLISLENIFEPVTEWVLGKLKVVKENKFYLALQSVKTLTIIFIGELFFRAYTVQLGKEMFFKIFTNFGASGLWDGTLLTLGMDMGDFVVVILGIIIVLIVDILKEKGMSIRETIAAQKIPVRWCIYYAALFGIIIFGAYGAGYLPVDLIYAGF